MIAILAVLVLAAGVASEPRQCQIDVCVTKPDPTAPRSGQLRDRVIGEPRVVTHFGRPAFFRTGGAQAILNGPIGLTGPSSELVPGIELEAIPRLLADGRIRLEMRVVRARGERGRKVAADLKPGERYRFRGPDGLWISVAAVELPLEK